MLYKLLFLITEGFKSLTRAKISALVSSFTIYITLIIFSGAYFSYINIVGYSFDFRKQYRIEVFFNTDLNRATAIDVFNKILILDGIEQGDFIDQQKAAEIFKTYFNKNIADIIGSNPLPQGGTFEIQPDYREVDKMNKIVSEIRLLPGVESAVFQAVLMSKIDKIIENLMSIFILLGGAIFLISIFLVSNTIRMTIYAQKENLQTLRLLGATDMFIKFPFLIEGIMQGLIGAVLSLITLWLGYSLIQYIFGHLTFVIIRPELFISGNIITGSVLGLIGSYYAISKYLK